METETASPAGPLHCAYHPRTETYLRCGRCDKPICAMCVVSTAVGSRCLECARFRKLPTYDLPTPFLARGVLAGVCAALVIGLLWGILLRLPIPYAALLLPLLAGFGVGEAIARSTNRKRHIGLQVTAALSLLLAFIVAVTLPLWLFLLSDGPGILGSLLSVAGRVVVGALFNPIYILGLVIGGALAISRVR